MKYKTVKIYQKEVLLDSVSRHINHTAMLVYKEHIDLLTSILLKNPYMVWDEDGRKIEVDADAPISNKEAALLQNTIGKPVFGYNIIDLNSTPIVNQSGKFRTKWRYDTSCE